MMNVDSPVNKTKLTLSILAAHCSLAGERRHDVGAGLAHQFGDGHNLVSALLQAGEHQVESHHRLAAIAAAIVQQNDVAAAQIARRAGRQVGQHIVRKLLGRTPRVVAPIIGIDLLANRDVAEVLCHLQRANLVGSIRRFVDGIRRPHQHRLHPVLALEEPSR